MQDSLSHSTSTEYRTTISLSEPLPVRPGISPRLRHLTVTVAVLAAVGVGVWGVTTSPVFRPPPITHWQTYTVRPGDTLWAIASRTFPQADPRQVVAEIEAKNHMSHSTVVVGEVLQVPTT